MCCLQHSHVGPVIGEFSATIEANDVMAGAGANCFPIAAGFGGFPFGCGKWLSGLAMTTGEIKELEEFLNHALHNFSERLDSHGRQQRRP